MLFLISCLVVFERRRFPLTFNFSFFPFDVSQVKIVALAALVASASAFAPAPFGARTATSTRHYDVGYGKYDEKLWDNDGTST